MKNIFDTCKETGKFDPYEREREREMRTFKGFRCQNQQRFQSNDYKYVQRTKANYVSISKGKCDEDNSSNRDY